MTTAMVFLGSLQAMAQNAGTDFSRLQTILKMDDKITVTSE